MQVTRDSPIKSDSRYDEFTVKWDGQHAGSLINSDRKFAGDKTTFVIDGNRLVVKSWIERHQAFETHTYARQ